MVEDPIKGNAFQKRQKKELGHLKAQAEVLSIHLKTINRPVRRVRGSTKWQRVARAELKAKLRAMAENELLKADITTNKAFIVEMEKFIQKKSSSTQGALLSEQWMQCKLVAHPSYRLKAIHAIADRQISFSALENPNQTRLTLLMEIVADASASAPPHLKIDASIDRIMALIRSEFMSQQVCRVPSQVHPLPASRILPPNLRTYLERARRLEALMWEAVHQVMDYHTNM
ncbi:hypothetical protein Ae201684P_021244 [Aphanomyces euteiches]|nr:hypothetical protein Ae201684P_021244 [Aphanomyces euteiches]